MSKEDSLFYETVESVNGSGSHSESLIRELKRPRERSEDLQTKSDEMTEEMKGMKAEMKEMRGEVKVLQETLKELLAQLTKATSEITPLNDSVRKVLLRMDEQDKRFDEIESKLKKQGGDVAKVNDVVSKWDERMTRIEERQIDQEARSRRNNLVFFGVGESGGLKEDTERVIRDVITKKCKMTDKLWIESAHRLGGKRAGAAKPRPVIVRFLDRKDREKVKWSGKNLPPGISVSEDFPVEIREARKRLVPDLKAAKRDNREAWIAFPARLIVEGKEVKVIKPSVSLLTDHYNHRFHSQR